MDIENDIKNKEISVLVRDRSGIIYEGRAESISSVNEYGEFDVLALHANFISLIRKELVLRDSKGIIKRLPITSGLARVADNRVEVYLGVVRSERSRI